jgi:hypothetical protein
MQQTPSQRRAFGTFVTFVVAAVLLKLWLVSGIRTLPAFGPHDASNFIDHAKGILHGAWFGEYNNLTLIKAPFFPLYLALIHELGIPLSLANELFYAAACFVACIAIRPIMKSGWLLGAVFAVTFFDPFTFATLAWVPYRSDVNVSLALLCLACALAVLVRRTEAPRAALPWLVGLGSAFAGFWLNREEAVWLVPCLVLFLGLSVWYGSYDRNAQRWPRLAAVVIPVAIWGLAVSSIMLVNLRVYGWATAVEQQAPEFVAAYNALARIVPPDPRFRVPVPHGAREIAYRVSPAARELEPTLEGQRGHAWANTSCAQWNVCGDIGGGWFIWAFRDAVSAAGHYKSGAEARAFYVRLAAEIDGACARREIGCVKKAATLMAPIDRAKLPDVLGDIVVGMRTFATFEFFDINHWPVARPATGLLDDYEFVTGTVATNLGYVYSGWLVHGPVRSIAVVDQSGNDVGADVQFKPSPDIYTAFSGRKDLARRDLGFARFSIATTCAENCALLVTTQQNHITQIPLALAKPGFQNADVAYRLDAVEPMGQIGADEELRDSSLLAIYHNYARAMPWLIVLVGGLAIARIARSIAKRRMFVNVQTILTAGSFGVIALLLVLLAVIDIFDFPAFTPEYMGSLVPILLFAIAVSVALEGSTAWRLLSRRLPTPSSSGAANVEQTSA